MGSSNSNSNQASDQGFQTPSPLAPAVLPWRRRRLVQRLLTLDRAQQFKGSGGEGETLDFQAAAVSWLIPSGILRHGKYRGASLLAMDVGCGKTRVVAEVLRKLDPISFLIVSPGGLVRQTVRELERANVKCGTAEKGETLRRNWGASVVVNRSLWGTLWRLLQERAWEPAAVFIDEAHCLPAAHMQCLLELPIPVVLITACPAVGRTYCPLWEAIADEDIFYMSKSPTIENNTRMPRLHYSPLQCTSQNLPGVRTRIGFLDFVREEYQDLMLTFQSARLLLAEGGDEDTVEAAALYTVARETGREIVERCRPSSLRRRKFYASYAAVLECCGERDERIVDECDAKGGECTECCSCCSIRLSDISRLRYAHDRYYGTASEVPEPNSIFDGKLYSRAILRLNGADTVEEYIARHGANTTAPLLSITSRQCAATRALRVESFCRRAVYPGALRILEREEHANSVFGNILRIGQGSVLRHLKELLADVVLLIADKSIDMGYNLQCVTDLVCTVLPRNAADAHQLCGRISRISSVRRPCALHCPVRRDTLDTFFVRHLS